jgi:HSPB1-associated protein 1
VFIYSVFFLLAELQEAYVVTLKPGDVLFVPHHWWHYVENVGTAVSINSWIPLVIMFDV